VDGLLAWVKRLGLFAFVGVIGAILFLKGDPAGWIIGSVMVVFLLGWIILRLLGWIILHATRLIIRVRQRSAPGDAESAGSDTLPNGIVIGPGEVVDPDGTRHPAPQGRASTHFPRWTGYARRAHPPE
jgi:hypothetical protein